MNERLTPPAWDDYDPNMLINVGDMKYYYENFTEVVDEQATSNKNAIATLDGRVAALEHSIPVGPGGDGAYLHLGGTPDRYPSAEEMVAGDTNEETSFMVIARPDGIHFYNPKTKVTIPPKKGGGTIAVHGQFPQIFDNGHNMTHNGRMDLSGVYTAKVSDVGLSTHFPSNPNCKVLIVVNEAGEEHQTAFSPDGMASRIFRAGEQSTPWMVSSGGGSGGGDVSKADLISGAQLVHANSFGSDPLTTANDITAANMASTSVVVGTGSVSGRKFIMADIADYTATSLTVNQAREGRVTYVVNMGTVSRSVELINRCKFNMDGTDTTLKQTIPAKTVWVFVPGIYGTGDKVWTYIGAFSTENIDIKDLIARLEALEAGGGGSGGGVTNFTGLIDTPSGYAGHGNRFLAVKADESGVEFVTTPSVDTKPIEDRLDVIDQSLVNHVADFELMRDGHIPTSWNGLGARPITSSNDITVDNIAESPFVIGTGTVAGKKFILPDIAELEVMSLGAGQVREGRATYLVNFGNVDRTIELTAGCKINVTGGAVTTAQTIPRRTAWMLSPGVYAGDKVWTFLGALSAENLDIAGTLDRLAEIELFFNEMSTGNVLTNMNGLGAAFVGTSAEISETQVASTPFITMGGTSARNIYLPEIVAMTADTLTSTQVRMGRLTYFVNMASKQRVLKLKSGHKFFQNNTYNTNDLVLPPKCCLMLLPFHSGSNKAWGYLGQYSTEDVIKNFTQLGDTPSDFTGSGGKVLAVNSGATAVEFVDKSTLVDLAPIEGRLDALEAVGSDKKFSELTDTPSDYRPGQVLRYNQAGDAVVSSEFSLKNLTDTPSDYAGNKGKMLVVNNGETAMEFANIPDHSGLQTDIDNNHNSIIALQNANNIQDGKITTLETDMGTVQGETLSLATDIADLDTRIETLENAPPSDILETALADGSALVDMSRHYAESVTDWDSVTQVQAAKRTAIIFWGTSVSKNVTMPDVADKDTTPLPAKAVRPGKIMFVANRSTVDKVIKVADGCQFMNGTTQTGSTTDITLKPKNAIVLMSHKNGSTKQWVVVGMYTTDHTVDMSSIGATADWKAKVESGDSAGKVNSNCVFGAMQIKDGALSASELATCSAGYVIGTTARTCTLPQVVDVNATPTATQARFGKQIRLINMSTQTMTINVQGSGRIYKPDNNHATSVTLAPQKFADFHAVWWPGGGFNSFAWVMMVP